MTLATFQYTSNPGTVMLASAVAGKRLRVRRLVVAADSNGYVQLLSDPFGGGSAITSRLYVAANRPLDVPLGKDGAVASASGKSLGLSSVSTNGSVKLALMVWYEAVN